MEIPAHIPQELVWDQSYDAFASEGDDPFRAIARLHDGPPLIWTHDAAFGRPGWIATRHEVISDALMDHAQFSGERHGMIADLVGEPVRLIPIETDPPAHHGYRRNLNPQFTPKAMAEMEDHVRANCVKLIAAFAQPDGCEFVSEFAVPFPTHIFLELMDLPRDRADEFLKWEEDLMRAPDPLDRVAAARAIYAYLCAHKDEQKAAPTNALNAAITGGEFEGRPLNHLEMMGMYYVLWVGGLDTVYSTLGWVMMHLAKDQTLQQQLRSDPSLISAAVEELMRSYSVVTTHRQVAHDCQFYGVDLKAGEELHLPLALANRDPSVFSDPHSFELGRKGRHIAFGFGPHNCLGVHLAKREIRVVIEEFLARFSAIKMREGETYRYHAGRTFGVDYLPLDLTR